MPRSERCETAPGSLFSADSKEEMGWTEMRQESFLRSSYRAPVGNESHSDRSEKWMSTNILIPNANTGTPGISFAQDRENSRNMVQYVRFHGYEPLVTVAVAVVATLVRSLTRAPNFDPAVSPPIGVSRSDQRSDPLAS